MHCPEIWTGQGRTESVAGSENPSRQHRCRLCSSWNRQTALAKEGEARQMRGTQVKASGLKHASEGVPYSMAVIVKSCQRAQWNQTSLTAWGLANVQGYSRRTMAY